MAEARTKKRVPTKQRTPAKKSAAAKKPAPSPIGETADDARKRALRVFRALTKAYPDAHVPLNYRNALELLVATILSAQCTDARVNEVTAPLFAKYRKASDWKKISVPKLEKMIHPTGFFRNKARAIHEATEDIDERFGGSVPGTMGELLSLRGIGRKSASVLLATIFETPAIVVDTHFGRISRRLGFTAEIDPTKIEFDLAGVVPRKHWSDFSLMLNWHGRVTCYARKPDCDACAARKHCPAFESRGEITWKVKIPASKRRPAKNSPAKAKSEKTAKAAAGAGRKRGGRPKR